MLNEQVLEKERRREQERRRERESNVAWGEYESRTNDDLRKTPKLSLPPAQNTLQFQSSAPKSRIRQASAPGPQSQPSSLRQRVNENAAEDALRREKAKEAYRIDLERQMKE